MKKKLLNSMRVLLVAAGLCAGASNVWADETIVFSQDFTAVEVEGATSTDPADYGFTLTYSSVVDGMSSSVTDGKLVLVCGKYGNGSKGYSYQASFDAIGEGNKVTFECDWALGYATGNNTQSYSRLTLTDGTNEVLNLTFYGQTGIFSVNGSTVVTSTSNRNKTPHVSATLDMTTKKISALQVGDIYTAATAIDFASSSATTVSKFNFLHYARASTWTNTSSIDNVVIKYEPITATYADVTFEYVDQNGNDLSSLKSSFASTEEVGTEISNLILPTYTADFFNGDNSVKYVYDSFDCEDATVPEGGTTVTLKFNALNKFTYNIVAVDTNNDELETIATTSGYAGETLTLSWSKYVKIDEQWYETNETTFHGTATENTDTKVKYSVSSIDYFIECESMGGVRTDNRRVSETANNYSGYERIRQNSYYRTITTAALSEGGVYNMTLVYSNSNTSTSTSTIQIISGGVTTNIEDWTCEASTSYNTYELNDIVIPAGGQLAIYYAGDGNANARMDYLTLTRIKETPSVTDYATFSSSYAIDFASATGVKAYYASASDGSTVTMTKVTGAVKAGTGLLLQKTDGAISIPTAATGTDLSATNLLKAGTGAAVKTEGTTHRYVLAGEGDATSFYELAESAAAVVIPEGKAYLEVENAGARLNISFSDGEATGIASVEQSNASADGIYNLNGQRVVNPTKGLYIVNGKKVIKK